MTAPTLERAALPGAWTACAHPDGQLAIAERPALGTTARVVTNDPTRIADALTAVELVLARLDLAASRFRPDSDLERLNGLACGPVVVGSRLRELIDVALAAARWTDGLVDPTIGAAVIDAGYDRDFAAVASAPGPVGIARPAPGWRRIGRHGEIVDRPAGVRLDLGATAKAFGADRAAEAAAAATGAGVLVSLGGDLAAAGPGVTGGWPVEIAEAAGTAPPAPVPHLRFAAGGLATSSTTKRRWRVGAGEAHHLIDPRTGEPARSPFRTASVFARSCTEANAASTAVLVGGDDALAWLVGTALPARLVRNDGAVVLVGGWPADDGGGFPDGLASFFATSSRRRWDAQ